MLQNVSFYFLLAISWSTAALWLFAIFWTRRELKTLRSLAPAVLALAEQPKVSILLPARNEEKRILPECVRSLLEQTYRNFEIVAVNDRSTDATGEILRVLKLENPVLQIVEGAKLPAGWLGKPFALQQALDKSGGEWILTTDADIVFAPRAIESAVAFAFAKNLDALCLIPLVRCETFWERIFIPTFDWFRMLRMPPARVNDRRRPETMGIGNFFLVKRRALARIGDFGLVKNDVAEDLRLAEKLKRGDFKIETHFAPDLLETRMYAGFSEIWRGFTKNFFAGSNFSLPHAAAGVGSIVLFGVLPFAACLAIVAKSILNDSDSFVWLLPPLFLIYLLQICLFTNLNRHARQPLRYAFFAPFGLILFAAILTNSTIKVLSGSGVVWKDRRIYKSGETAPPAKV